MHIMTEQSKIIDKIKKCLNLAKSSNANESASALRVARRMMKMHGVTSLDVDAAQASEEAVKSNVKKTPSEWECLLVATAANAFSCKTIFSRGIFFTETQWKFIGTGAGPQLATYAFEVLIRQLKKDRANYIKTKLRRCKKANKTARADTYCYAWVLQVYRTVQEFAPNEAQEKAINAFMDKKYSNLKDINSRSRNTNYANNNAWKDHSQGSIDGSKASLNKGVNKTNKKMLETS
jgi:hypothetical protein